MFGLYLISVLIVWVISSRLFWIHFHDKEEDSKSLALFSGACVSVLWPLSLLIFVVYKLAFFKKKNRAQ